MWIEKREQATADVAKSLASALGLRVGDIGTAGLKDKWAVTKQFFSLPGHHELSDLQSEDLPGVKVVSACAHNNKLKTGHLRGNRFALRVRELDLPLPEAAERAKAILEALSRQGGAPNWYGPQRFGRQGSNVEVGRALVTGEKLKGRPPRGRQRRLYISAFQSWLFNAYLRKRLEAGSYGEVLEGDILQKRDSGGLFVAEELATEQARLDAGELAITGPMFGHKMKRGPAESSAWNLEEEILAKDGLALPSFAPLGKLALGTRRPLSMPLDAWDVLAGDDFLELRFSLPSGSYATAAMREVMKVRDEFPN